MRWSKLMVYLVWYWDDDGVPVNIAMFQGRGNARARKEKEEKDGIEAIVSEYETED